MMVCPVCVGSGCCWCDGRGSEGMSKRDELVKRLNRFQLVPGHGPDTDKATDEELELFVEILESMSEAGRRAKEE